MKQLEDALRKCKKLYQTYEKQIKIAVIALVVVTALLLFGGNGEKKEINVEQGGGIQTEQLEEPVQESKTIVVDISGCIKSPGVFEVKEGTRLHQVIEKAGGLTKKADINAINRAELVTDGQKILIPAKSETERSDSTENDRITGTTINQTNNGKININQADRTALQEIPGVGPATAEKILLYRETNGRFQSIEDLKNVSGIGEKTFEKMKDRICV